jgi:hypothetical protein
MKRIRIQRPKLRKERRYDPLPLDPRDPDILRGKQLTERPPSAGLAQIDEGNAWQSDMSSTTSDFRIAILSSNLGGRLQGSRIDALEAYRDRGYWPRRVGALIAGVLITQVVAALVVVRLG